MEGDTHIVFHVPGAHWGCTTGGPDPTLALSVLLSASAHSKVSPLLKGDRKTGWGDFGIMKFS